MSDRSRYIKINASDIIEETTLLHNFNKYKGYGDSVSNIEELVDEIEEINRVKREENGS